jgi:hypothetical protein
VLTCDPNRELRSGGRGAVNGVQRFVAQYSYCISQLYIHDHVGAGPSFEAAGKHVRRTGTPRHHARMPKDGARQREDQVLDLVCSALSTDGRTLKLVDRPDRGPPWAPMGEPTANTVTA